MRFPRDKRLTKLADDLLPRDNEEFLARFASRMATNSGVSVQDAEERIHAFLNNPAAFVNGPDHDPIWDKMVESLKSKPRE